MKVEVRARAKVLGIRPKQPFYWRIVAINGEPIAQSETYTNKADALDTARLIVGDRAEIVDLTGETSGS